MKREISAMNDELPSEIVDLLTDNLYGSVETFDKDEKLMKLKLRPKVFKSSPSFFDSKSK